MKRGNVTVLNFFRTTPSGRLSIENKKGIRYCLNAETVISAVNVNMFLSGIKLWIHAIASQLSPTF